MVTFYKGCDFVFRFIIVTIKVLVSSYIFTYVFIEHWVSLINFYNTHFTKKNLMTHLVFLLYLLCVVCVINTFLWHIFYEIHLEYTTIELYIVPLYLHQFVVQKTYRFHGSSFTFLAEKLA